VHLLPPAFASKGLNVGQEGYSWGAGNNGLNAVHFIKIVPLSGRKYLSSEIESEFDKFYVDESIVTFHSPDIENCRDKHLQLRIVGTAPINSIYSDVQIQTSTIPYIENGGLDYSKLIDYRKVGNVDSILSSDYLYWDG